MSDFSHQLITSRFLYNDQAEVLFMAGITSCDPLKENLQKSKQGFAKLSLQGITSSDPVEKNQHYMNDLSGIYLSSPPLLKAGFQRINKGIASGDPFMGTCRSQSRDSLRVSPSVSMAAPHE